MMVQIVVTIPDLAMGNFLSSVFRSVIKEGENHTHTQAATIFLLGLVNVTRVPCDGVVQVGLTMGMWHVSVLTYSKKSPHTGETS